MTYHIGTPLVNIRNIAETQSIVESICKVNSRNSYCNNSILHTVLLCDSYDEYRMRIKSYCSKNGRQLELSNILKQINIFIQAMLNQEVINDTTLTPYIHTLSKNLETHRDNQSTYATLRFLFFELCGFVCCTIT